MSNLNRERDFDLIRSILLKIESSHPQLFLHSDTFKIEGYDPLVIFIHIEMLNDAGFIEADISKSNSLDFIGSFTIKKILPNGYEFLENAKNDTVWKKFKDRIKKFGSSVSMRVTIGVLTDIVKELL